MDVVQANRFDAAHLMGKSMPDENEPSLETMFVAEAMAGLAIERFATNLAAYLAGDVQEPGETGRQTVERLLGLLVETPLDPDITDLPRARFDADEAQSIALDKIADLVDTVRKVAL